MQLRSERSFFRIIVGLSLRLALCLVAACFLYRLIPSRTISYSCRTPLSVFAYQQLDKFFLSNKQRMSSMSAAKLLTLLQTKLPSATAVRITKRHPGVMHIAISYDPPLALINQNIVITKHGSLVPATQLPAESVQKLPALQAPQLTREQAGDLARLLERLPLSIFEQYTLVWESRERVRLIDKTQGITLIMSATTAWTERLEQAVHDTLTQLDALHIPKKKKLKPNTPILLDLRHDGWLILTSAEEKGEA